MVERLLAKQESVGSIPTIRSKELPRLTNDDLNRHGRVAEWLRHLTVNQAREERMVVRIHPLPLLDST